MKRAFDVTASLAGLLLLTPVFALVALLIKRDSPGPVFFRHERVGRGFRPFHVLKFRTMVVDAPRLGGPITWEGAADPRITRVGSFLRRTKLDELPQLLNVVRGEMSLVGPRPEIRRYVEQFRDDYETILTVRPGMTDLASLQFKDEAVLLARASNAQEAYEQVILPAKIALSKQHIERASLRFDIGLIVKTILRIIIKDRSVDPGLNRHGRCTW